MAAPMKRWIVRSLQLNLGVFKICKRCYARGFRRMPVNILSAEEEREKIVRHKLEIKDPRKNANVSYLPHDPVQKNVQAIRNEPVTARKRDRKNQILDNNTKTYSLKGVDIEYTRIEETDMSKKFVQIVMNANSRSQKGKRKEIVLEGKHLIRDALRANGIMKYLYISKMDALDGLPADLIDCPVYRVPHKHLKVWSDTDSSQGVIAVFEMPKEGESTAPRLEEIPVTLICDRVTDPGSMGAIIRSAAAVGCSKLITMPGCVDVWNRKVLRSGAGGHFRQPIIPNMSWSQLINYIPDDSCVFMADSRRPSRRVLDLITRCEQENDDATVDSQEIDDDLVESDGSDGYISSDDLDQPLKNDVELSTDELRLYKKLPLDVSLYNEVDCVAKGHTVLLVGGDTGGFSPQARKLVFDLDGQCLLLPMATGINALNSSVVTSVLLFEIYRQLQDKKRIN